MVMSGGDDDDCLIYSCSINDCGSDVVDSSFVSVVTTIVVEKNGR